MKKQNVTVINNPLTQHYLSTIRNKNSSILEFKTAIEILGNILAINSTQNLPLEEVETETPIITTKTKIIDSKINIFIAPILRAGLGISQSLVNILPFAKVQHLGMYRNEKTLEPVWYYNKLPQNFKNPQNSFVYICDPMLATGGSAIEVIKLYIEKNIPQENITFINLICSPEGLNRITTLFPKIKIFTCSIDEKLNEKGYIVPGLGDAGDRIFNTIY